MKLSKPEAPIKIKIRTPIDDDDDDMALFKVNTSGTFRLSGAIAKKGAFKIRPALSAKLPTQHFDLMLADDLDDDQIYAYMVYKVGSGYQLRMRHGYLLKDEESRKLNDFIGHVRPPKDWRRQISKQPADHHRTQELASGNDRMKNIEVLYELYKKIPGRLVRDTIEMSISVQAPTPRYLEVLRKNGLLDKYLNA
jgi:hypothetical protein